VSRPRRSLADVLAACGRGPEALLLCARVGSWVYGTAAASSDEDVVAVVRDTAALRDVVQRDGLDVVVFGHASFRESLRDGNVFAHEALLAPEAHRLLAARAAFSVGAPSAIVASACERVGDDLAKARRRRDDLAAATRLAFHALRVAAYASQLATTGTLTSFDASALRLEVEELMTGGGDPFVALERRLVALPVVGRALAKALRSI
jgi:hypothetical protein